MWELVREGHSSTWGNSLFPGRTRIQFGPTKFNPRPYSSPGLAPAGKECFSFRYSMTQTVPYIPVYATSTGSSQPPLRPHC